MEVMKNEFCSTRIGSNIGGVGFKEVVGDTRAVLYATVDVVVPEGIGLKQ